MFVFGKNAMFFRILRHFVSSCHFHPCTVTMALSARHEAQCVKAFFGSLPSSLGNGPFRRPSQESVICVQSWQHGNRLKQGIVLWSQRQWRRYAAFYGDGVFLDWLKENGKRSDEYSRDRQLHSKHFVTKWLMNLVWHIWSSSNFSLLRLLLSFAWNRV